MRSGLPQSEPRGGLTFNLRSAGRDFANGESCLVIASGFYEFTGTSDDCRHLAARGWQPVGRVRHADGRAGLRCGATTGGSSCCDSKAGAPGWTWGCGAELQRGLLVKGGALEKGLWPWS